MASLLCSFFYVIKYDKSIPFLIKKDRNMAKKLSIVEKKTKKFMKSVRAFLASKSGGQVPMEWECSLLLLEEYYKQFVMLTEEINKLDSVIVDSRYGSIPHPLLAARDKSAIRLEALMKALGLTLKAALSMDIAEPVIEESPLESFVKGKVEKR